MAKLKIAYLTTWPPRECGIATFTQDVAKTIAQISPKIDWEVIALNEPNTKYDYDRKVVMIIERDKYETYKKAAQYINESEADAINFQHEFNLFEPKNHLRRFLEMIKKPIITTLHTVFFPEIYKTPKLKKRNIALRSVLKNSDYIVTMCQSGIEKIIKEYSFPRKNAFVIPHGAPEIERISSGKAKKKIGYQNKNIILSYGLIGKGKNFEQMIKAMPEILKRFPNTVYVIAGETHPRLSHDYHNFLKFLAKKLRLADKIVFIDHYMALDKIKNLIQATDIFVNTGRILNMVSSGTLTYAMVAGKCVISTPFIYAKDVLAKGRGQFVNVNDHQGLAKIIINLFKNPKKIKQYEDKAYRYGRLLTWPKVCKEYVKLFEIAARDKK